MSEPMGVGISFSTDEEGNVLSARLMGPPYECLTLELPVTENSRWCGLPWPHDGSHVFEKRETYEDHRLR